MLKNPNSDYCHIHKKDGPRTMEIHKDTFETLEARQGKGLLEKPKKEKKSNDKLLETIINDTLSQSFKPSAYSTESESDEDLYTESAPIEPVKRVVEPKPKLIQQPKPIEQPKPTKPVKKSEPANYKTMSDEKLLDTVGKMIRTKNPSTIIALTELKDRGVITSDDYTNLISKHNIK